MTLLYWLEIGVLVFLIVDVVFLAENIRNKQDNDVYSEMLEKQAIELCKKENELEKRESLLAKREKAVAKVEVSSEKQAQSQVSSAKGKTTLPKSKVKA